MRAVLRTAQGEYESFPAVETGPATGRFVASIPFAFDRGDPVAGDGRIEGRLDTGVAANAVPVLGSVRRGGDSAGAGITLLSQLNDALRAHARDRDGDGRADAVALVFSRKLDRMPPALDSIYWNGATSANLRGASGSRLTLSPDSLTLWADPKEDPFARFLTGIPAGAVPAVLLPGGGYFGNIRIPLSDSVGPVSFQALKRPSSLTTYAVGDERRFEPDTLVITVSEPLRTTRTWSGGFRFSKAQDCGDAGAILSSIPIPTFRQPVAEDNRTRFTLLVDNDPGSRIPLKGDCVFLDATGLITDLGGTPAGILGIALEGGDPIQVIRGVSGYPPVAGLDPRSSTYSVANSGNAADDRSMQVMGSEGGLEILWIPPVDFPSGWTAGDSYKPQAEVRITDPPEEGNEAQGLKTLPPGFNAVQVITSGRYIAHIKLFDNHGVFVKAWKQKFGFDGELRNTYRITNLGVRSFLVWDRRDARGGLAGNGAYVRRVIFELDDRKQEVRHVRTGLVR